MNRLNAFDRHAPLHPSAALGKGGSVSSTSEIKAFPLSSIQLIAARGPTLKTLASRDWKALKCESSSLSQLLATFRAHPDEKIRMERIFRFLGEGDKQLSLILEPIILEITSKSPRHRLSSYKYRVDHSPFGEAISTSTSKILKICCFLESDELRDCFSEKHSIASLNEVVLFFRSRMVRQEVYSSVEKLIGILQYEEIPGEQLVKIEELLSSVDAILSSKGEDKALRVRNELERLSFLIRAEPSSQVTFYCDLSPLWGDLRQHFIAKCFKEEPKKGWIDWLLGL